MCLACVASLSHASTPSINSCCCSCPAPAASAQGAPPDDGEPAFGRGAGRSEGLPLARLGGPALGLVRPERHVGVEAGVKVILGLPTGREGLLDLVPGLGSRLARQGQARLRTGDGATPSKLPDTAATPPATGIAQATAQWACRMPLEAGHTSKSSRMYAGTLPPMVLSCVGNPNPPFLAGLV